MFSLSMKSSKEPMISDPFPAFYLFFRFTDTSGFFVFFLLVKGLPSNPSVSI